jgi:ubiquinone/menaquinone biosynthesis C-methylase UbiE
LKDYIEVNERKTEKLLKMLKSKVYLSQKRANKRNTFKFVKGLISRKWEMLDIGCRDGMWMDMLKKAKFKNLRGMDISEKALEIARKKGHNVTRGDAQELPFPDETFHFVSIIHTLEHCPDPNKVIAGIKRVLKTNGRILIVVPMQKKEPVPTVWAHYFCFSKPKEVIDLLVRNGFKKIKVQTKQRPHNRFLFRKLREENDETKNTANN